MARHHDRLIANAQATVAAVGQPRERTEPRTHAEVESYVRGFGLSTAATRQLVDEWTADIRRAHRTAWSDGYDSGYGDGQQSTT
jgi:hypothetical protein